MNGSVTHEGLILQGGINVDTSADLEELTAYENGVYNPSEGKDGFSKVTVDVPAAVLDDITITENGHYTPPIGVDGYDDITVSVPHPAPVLDDITITENGSYQPPTGVDGYDDITVNVLPTLDDITITENGTYTPPTGTDGYNEITVNVPLPANGIYKQTLTGLPSPIATFTGADAPLDKLVISVDAVQEGSGDPSPTNIRPISGWSGANVVSNGINQWDEVWELGTIDVSNGNNATSSSRIRCKNYIPIKPNTEYNYYQLGTATTGRVCYYDKDKNFIGGNAEFPSGGTTFVNPTTFRTPENAYYMKISPAQTYGVSYNNDISINYPSTETQYHPYNGTNVTISFGQDVYGGVLNVSTGVLTVTHGHRIYNGTEGWAKSVGYNQRFSVTFSEIETTNVAADKISNRFRSTIWGADNNTFGLRSDGAIYICFDNSGEDMPLNDFKNWLASNNVEVVYKLATPQTIQLTPTQVRTIQGNNNVFADCGEVTECKYYSETP